LPTKSTPEARVQQRKSRSRNVALRRAGSKKRSKGPSGAPAAKVFLNVPYDRAFTELFLAYIAGLVALGLLPRTTLEIPGGERRLDRTLDLIRSCPFSVHDLSRIDTPRFNMPFELGLAVACQKLVLLEQKWFVFVAKRGRIEKALSDLQGTDVYVHHGRPSGVFGELANAFVRSERRPTVKQMRRILRGLTDELPALLRNAGARSCFTARVFDDLKVLARRLSDRYVA
jgi:hypothetical protein